MAYKRISVSTVVTIVQSSSLWLTLRVSQGFWGTREHWQNIEGNKGTLANFWEQGNRIRKSTVRINSDIINREHANMGT